MNIRPATAEDISRFYGDVAVPMEMVALGDVAIAGLAKCADGLFAVSWIDSSVREPAGLVRLALAVLEMAERAEEPVYATPDPEEPTATRCLEWLGFQRDGDRYYVYRVDLPGRLFVRHARRASRAVPVDAGRTGSDAGPCLAQEPAQ